MSSNFIVTVGSVGLYGSSVIFPLSHLVVSSFMSSLPSAFSMMFSSVKSILLLEESPDDRGTSFNASGIELIKVVCSTGAKPSCFPSACPLAVILSLFIDVIFSDFIMKSVRILNLSSSDILWVEELILPGVVNVVEIPTVLELILIEKSSSFCLVVIFTSRAVVCGAGSVLGVVECLGLIFKTLFLVVFADLTVGSNILDVVSTDDSVVPGDVNEGVVDLFKNGLIGLILFVNRFFLCLKNFFLLNLTFSFVSSSESSIKLVILSSLFGVVVSKSSLSSTNTLCVVKVMLSTPSVSSFTVSVASVGSVVDLA